MVGDFGVVFGRRAGLAGRRVLLIDADAARRRGLASQLAYHGAGAVAEADSAAAGVTQAQAAGLDAILAWTGLPDLQPEDLCRALRHRGFRAPIILLSSAAADAQQIAVLDAGANDVVVGPYQFDVLVARLRAHWRLYASSDDAVLRVGPYRFQPSRRRLMNLKSGARIVLTEKEAGLLRYFCQHADETILVAEIMREVWNYRSEIPTHTAQTHIYRLRHKIEANPSDPQIIVSVPGGYRLGVGADGTGGGAPASPPPEPTNLGASRAA